MQMSHSLERARVLVGGRAPGLAMEVLANFVLPFVVYDLAEKPLGQVHALMAASALPMAWALFEFVRRRRVDALSLLVLAGIGLSLLVYLGGGSVRFLQLREKLVTVLVGLVFLGSAAIGKPLMYQLGRAVMRRRNPSELAGFEALREQAGFRRSMTVMTVAWGTVLIAEAALSAALVLVLSIRQYLIVGPLLGYGAIGAVGLWSFLYVRARRRKALALHAAAAGAPLPQPAS